MESYFPSRIRKKNYEFLPTDKYRNTPMLENKDEKD